MTSFIFSPVALNWRRTSSNLAANWVKMVLTANVSFPVSKVSVLFGSPLELIVRNKILSLRLKCRVYKAVVLPALLYVAKAWTTKHPFSFCRTNSTTSVCGVPTTKPWLSSKKSAARYHQTLLRPWKSTPPLHSINSVRNGLDIGPSSRAAAS